MDSEYVQEHILTGGIVALVEGASPLIHDRLQPIRQALSPHTQHICGARVRPLAPPPNRSRRHDAQRIYRLQKHRMCW